ncbi:MAG: hypothetical protein VX764_10335 [Planctomycetota bacterium]|nr:hypothetical protein [Planctomycetota bacterium]
MRRNENRSPGSLRAHLPSRIAQRAVLPLLTWGVALTLIVVPGVPVISGPDDAIQASDEKPAQVTTQEQDVKAIEGWIRDLSDDSWAIRSVARQKLIARGQLAVASLEKALESSDPEVREQAQAIIEQLKNSKKQTQPVIERNDGPGIVETSVIRFGPDRSIQIKIGSNGQVEIDSGRQSGEQDPLEAIRIAEQQMKDLEQQMLRRFPAPFRRGAIFDPFDPFSPFDQLWPQENWIGPGRGGPPPVRFSRDGQIVFDSSSSSSVMSLEPAGLTFETIPPSLRAHLPSLPEGGFLISRVRDGSFGASVGLKKWDILVSLGETSITSLDQIEKMLNNFSENSRWGIIRGGRVTTLESNSQPNQQPKRF